MPLKSLARSVVMRPGLGISRTLLFRIQWFKVQFLLAQLAAGDLLILRAADHQLGMGALAHQTALVQHQDLVCVQHGGDALCHDDDGGVVGLGLQGAAQGHVGLVVQGRETVVEQINFGVLGNGTGDGQALLLAAGHIGTALSDGACVALAALRR